MSLSRVEITQEAIWTCLSHAHTSETEEIMGVLLGNTHEENGQKYARLWMALPQARTDRRKDRVECNPEQLTHSASIAEKFTQKTGQVTRVVGWYHSHPHMIVSPSVIDVATQARYQQLDTGFVGIIISCFCCDDNTKVQTNKITAFQSVKNVVRPQDRYHAYGHEDVQTQAAIQASMEQGDDSWVKKEVPIVVVKSTQHFEGTMSDFLSISNTLISEEKKRYQERIVAAQNRTNQPDIKNLPMHNAHYAATYYQSLVRFMNGVLLAQLEAVKLKRLQTSFQLRQMQSQLNEMEREKDKFLDSNFQQMAINSDNHPARNTTNQFQPPPGLL
eukprot:TRINITY_DN18932_c0_g1_i11.p1 TRINITY_DN18932_c0_g1~~TRINITY_DN18932_c0_g1_i11.p1  ORF type:complete len:331 (-),score=41.90 TRINITY_DN18932_c0_g1_i11:334-1326(-)